MVFNASVLAALWPQGWTPFDQICLQLVQAYALREKVEFCLEFVLAVLRRALNTHATQHQAVKAKKKRRAKYPRFQRKSVVFFVLRAAVTEHERLGRPAPNDIMIAWLQAKEREKEGSNEQSDVGMTAAERFVDSLWSAACWCCTCREEMPQEFVAVAGEPPVFKSRRTDGNIICNITFFAQQEQVLLFVSCFCRPTVPSST
jgi:hypothetical protein